MANKPKPENKPEPATEPEADSVPRADDLIERTFLLGVAAAEHVHNMKQPFRTVASAPMLQALRDIAAGRLTLVDTAEEVLAERERSLAQGPAGNVHAHFPRLLRDWRVRERQIARHVLKAMYGEKGPEG
jgi:hypothetical protein